MDCSQSERVLISIDSHLGCAYRAVALHDVLNSPLAIRPVLEADTETILMQNLRTQWPPHRWVEAWCQKARTAIPDSIAMRTR